MSTNKELFAFILGFIRKQKWSFLVIFFLDAFTWAGDAVVWPYILHEIVDIFSHFENERFLALKPLFNPLALGLGIIIVVEVSSRVMGFMFAKVIPKLQADIRMYMFDHIQHHSPRYFNERFAGNLVNKVNDMTSQVEQIIFYLFWPLLPIIFGCLLASIFLWFVHPIFTVILLVWVILHFSFCLYSALRVGVLEHSYGMARSALVGKIVDSFTNNFAVNLFYRFDYEQRNLQPYQEEEVRTKIIARNYVEKMRVYLAIFYFGCEFFGMFVALIYLWINDFISTGQVVQVFTTIWNLSRILWMTGNILPSFFQSIGIARQAHSVLKEPSDLGDQPDAKPLRISRGEIVFDNVSFRYEESALFVNKHAKIKGGEKVGLVGYSGAGKSTFVNLILRLFPIQAGEISIDGQAISRVSLQSLRNQIALIPQDPILFHRTLRENICYGKPEVTKEEFLHAAKLAHCDEFISRFSNGYETKVGERGTKLSGGEKQRIAIARAILLDAPILILDEATSALDSVTENYIQESLEKLMENRTTLVIAHRLSTLAKMDRILVFDKGQIVEEGAHKVLLNKNGLYAKMWRMQVGGFLPDLPQSC